MFKKIEERIKKLICYFYGHMWTEISRKEKKLNEIQKTITIKHECEVCGKKKGIIQKFDEDKKISEEEITVVN